MSDPVNTLLVDVRANTQAFAQDVARLRSTFDATLVDGFARAGTVLETSLTGALRKGSQGFGDLQRVALEVLGTIAAAAGKALVGSASGGGGGAGGDLVAAGFGLAGTLGLPGRATGGPVAPGRGYLVGERGPELFVPASAGRIEPGSSPGPGSAAGRDVRVAITLHSPAGTAAPQALQRSARQVAAAVRRALRDN